MDMYQEFLMDHYRHPRNCGILERADFSTGEFNPSCGDSIALQGKITDTIITEIAFMGKGCVISQATASILTEWSKEKKIEELLKIDKDILQAMIRIQLGPMRLKCALLPLSALQKGLMAYTMKK